MSNKLLTKAKNIILFIINIFKKLLEKPISKFRFIIVLDLLIKSKLFMTMIESDTADKLRYSDFTFKCTLVYLATILIIYSFGYLLNKNKQVIYYIIFDVLFSALLVGDLWCYRSNNDFLAVKNLLFPGTFNPMGGSLIQNFKPIDLIFVFDIVIIIVFLLFKKINNDEERRPWKFWFVNRYCISFLAIAYFLIDVTTIYGWSYTMLTTRWTTLMSARATGPIGYHVVEAAKSIGKSLTDSPSASDKEKVQNWIDYNKENLAPNEYEGVCKGKNVLFIQLESFENFIINRETNGKEITPFLNKLSREGLYFNNFYQQNNAGNSIDCDFMVNTSVFPLGGDTITALNYGEKVYSNSLPRLLEGEGYETITTHAEENNSFNWNEIHKNGFGAEKLWNIKNYNYDETVGYGLSDRSFYTQVAEKLQNENKPFFLQMPTLSSHGPFNIDKLYRTLDLREDVDQSYLGGYFESANYSDRQLEMLFNKLDNEGLLDNTMIVIYGDHAGVHKYYNEDIQELNYEDGWWKEYDQKIPLFIYSKGMKPEVIEAAGGQVDILPTVAYLLGIDSDKYENTSMGRVLVNTNRNATVIKGNEIKGNVQNDEEKQHLLDAYSIGDIIIKKDMFNTSK